MICKNFLLSIFVLFCFTTATLAQDVTTNWPYKYSDFRSGTIYFKDREAMQGKFNIHLQKSTLHYLEGDKIKEAFPEDIAYVVIDNIIQGVAIHDKYYMYNDQLIRLVSGDSTAFVADIILADYSALKETGGAYGSSSNVQSTRKLSSLAGDIGYIELKKTKEEGSLLPVTQKYFIVFEGKVYPANSKAIESKLTADKAEAFKQFIKKNKINWKNPESLMAVLGFLKS